MGYAINEDMNRFQDQIIFIDLFVDFHRDVFTNQDGFDKFVKYFGVNEENFTDLNNIEKYFSSISQKMTKKDVQIAFRVARRALLELDIDSKEINALF